MLERKNVIILGADDCLRCEHCKGYLKKQEQVFDFYVGGYVCDYCLELLVLTDNIPFCDKCGCGVGLERDINNCKSCCQKVD